MNDTAVDTQAEQAQAGVTQLDALVIGAGFSGLYQLKKLRDMGMHVRAYEAGSGVGGT